MKNLISKRFITLSVIVLIAFIGIVLLLNDVVLPWYVSRPEKKVPWVVGMNKDKAMQLLKDSSLVPVIGDTTFDAKFPEGTIIYQKPNADETVKIGRRVYLFVSGGEPVVNVPDLKGKSLRDAKFALDRVGLVLGKVDSVISDNPKNMIFDQQYIAGTPLKQGDSVGVSMSTGSEFGSVIVPNLLGKPLTEAEKILSDNLLKVGKISYQTSYSMLPNTVLDQYPSKGNKLNPGDAVDLFVTKAADSGSEGNN